MWDPEAEVSNPRLAQWAYFGLPRLSLGGWVFTCTSSQYPGPTHPSALVGRVSILVGFPFSVQQKEGACVPPTPHSQGLPERHSWKQKFFKGLSFLSNLYSVNEVGGLRGGHWNRIPFHRPSPLTWSPIATPLELSLAPQIA